MPLLEPEIQTSVVESTRDWIVLATGYAIDKGIFGKRGKLGKGLPGLHCICICKFHDNLVWA